MKRFRIVRHDDYGWRVDERSSTIFGLIKSWDRIAYFPTYKVAYLYLIRRFGNEEMTIEDNEGYIRFDNRK